MRELSLPRRCRRAHRERVHPGSFDLTVSPTGDTAFGSTRSDTAAVQLGHMPSGAVVDANYRLKAADLPFHRLVDETDRNSDIVTTTNDRLSSSGAFAGTFVSVGAHGRHDVCDRPAQSIFHAGPFLARQVEPRNTPSFHNAVFNQRNFWDNRANNLFNGVGSFGLRDVNGKPGDPDDPRNNHRLVVLENGHPVLTHLTVENASLASQAVAPPVSALEMSCSGRTFPDIGRKLLATMPLRRQDVSRHDSVLGPFARHHGPGLDVSYALLIKRAFPPKYWALPGRYRIAGGQLVADPHGYTQMELNFPMFWGLAIAYYEATQIADRTEVDMLQASGHLVISPSFAATGPNIGGCSAPMGGVDPLLLRGCTIFMRGNAGPQSPTPLDGIRGGTCFVCHNAPAGGVGRATAPLLTESAIQAGEPPAPLFLTVRDANGLNDLRDNGSANIGLRNVASDRLLGLVDPYGGPLSYARQYANHLDGVPDAVLDPLLQRLIDAGSVPVRVGTSAPTPPNTFRKLEADGAAKVPILRNVALTPPYFSWGGYPSLRQLLKVYNRGMNRRDITAPLFADAHGSACTSGDDSGTGPGGASAWPFPAPDCNTNTTGVIIPLGLSDCDANGQPNAACLAHGHSVANDDLAALERFLKALTDRRVQCDQAPFDHPELVVFAAQRAHDANGDMLADDTVFSLPAVGAAGYPPSSGLCIPNTGDLFAPGMQARAGGLRVPLSD